MIQFVAQVDLLSALPLTAVGSVDKDLLLDVSADDLHAPEGQPLRASAVLHSEDDDRTFRVRVLVEGQTAEYRGLLMNVYGSSGTSSHISLHVFPQQ